MNKSIHIPPHFCAFPKPAHTFPTSYLQWCEMRCDCSFFSKLIELLVVYGYEQISIWGGTTGSDTVRMLDQKWRHQKSRDFSPYFFPYFFSGIFFPSTFFPRTFSNYFISISSYFFSPYIFFPYFFPPYFAFAVLFSRTFSNVATFEIQRFKISVSCFSRTCRYNTVHVPCGIFIQTSPVGLHLKGPKMNLFNLKESSSSSLSPPTPAAAAIHTYPRASSAAAAIWLKFHPKHVTNKNETH